MADADIKSEGFFTQSLADSDPALFASIEDELTRQRDEIELIASENIASRAVIEAQDASSRQAKRRVSAFSQARSTAPRRP